MAMEGREYNYVEEMEILVSGYEEIQAILGEVQGNLAERWFLPVNLLKKLNEQLRDHYSSLRSDIIMYETLEKYRQELQEQKVTVTKSKRAKKKRNKKQRQ